MHLDYRDINREMAIFAGNELAGSGLPLWLPSGAAIRNELQKLAKDLAHDDGCLDVYSPVLGKRALFERSGHLAKFADDMFPPMALGDDELMLRPANCPHHALVFASSPHSYRDLPIRLNELGSMFRAERSGVVSGLNRVRQISLDDTHVFCRPDQVADEAALGLRTALKAQAILGLPVDYIRLSRRDERDVWLGSKDQWDAAEESLRVAGSAIAADHELELLDAPGEAAFYGPKFDLQVRGLSSHEETIATVQLDFNQPERFDLAYMGADGGRHRVVMIHRGTVGSMERVVAALVEHYQGRLPLWLAPVQVTVLPVSADQDAPAKGLVGVLRSRNLRVHIETDGSLGARIRRARQRRDAVLAVIGKDESHQGAAHVSDFAAGFKSTLPVSDLCARLVQARDQRLAAIRW